MTWFEEPVSSDDLRCLADLSRDMPLDVTAGEYGLDAFQVTSRCEANKGVSRCWAIPPRNLTSRRFDTELTRLGARAAIRAHSGSQPIE